MIYIRILNYYYENLHILHIFWTVCAFRGEPSRSYVHPILLGWKQTAKVANNLSTAFFTPMKQQFCGML